MARITHLPPELLPCIFDHIMSVKHLATCRLVCRAWNYPAEQCMFGKEIQIKNDEQAVQLYGHLCKDPTKGKLIKHMDFQIESKDLHPIYKHLLRLAFTPSIHKLTGTVEATTFYTTLIQIVDDSLTDFNQLVELPAHASDFGNAAMMVEAATRFSNFTDLTFTIGTGDARLNWNVINLLVKFKRLSTITLSGGYIADWKLLESALGKCANLKNLTIEKMLINGSTTSREDVSSWVSNSNVPKATSLTAITFQDVRPRPDVLEYLLYKYPKVNVVTVKSGFNDSNYHSLNRILDAVDKVARKDLTFILPSNTNMKEALRFARSRHEDIKFQIEEVSGREELVMKIK